MFDPIHQLALGLVTGIVFGFLLQKGRVAKYEVILGQLLLKDWTVVKVMGTAIVVGAVGVYLLVAAEMASLHIQPAQIGGIVAGAILFGVGMAIFGYCPGTSVAACGEGRRDAMIGIAGMLTGAAIYVASFPAMQSVAKSLGSWGEITLPDITGGSPWPWIAGLAIAGGISYALDRYRTPIRSSARRSLRDASASP